MGSYISRQGLARLLSGPRPEAWQYSRGERLLALLDRARAGIDHLLRERCDRPADAAALDRRVELLQDRFRKLSAAARVARRAEQLADARTMAATAPGLVPPALAALIGLATPAGHDG